LKNGPLNSYEFFVPLHLKLEVDEDKVVMGVGINFPTGSPLGLF